MQVSVSKGAKIIYGDLDFKMQEKGLENGFWFHPLILENVTKEQPAYCEELFGPVFSLFKFNDPIEMVDLANATDYGLSASIFTEDMARAKHEALQLDVGTVFINDFVASDPAIPGGGIKDSGYGRECYKDGVHETINRKAIVYGK